MSFIFIRTILCIPLIVAIQGAVPRRSIFRENILHNVLDLIKKETTTLPNDSDDTVTEYSCKDKSSFVREDLEAIVDYMYDELKLNESITKSYVPKAMELKNKYLNRLEMFDEWFKDQPEHLKHIIKDLADRRKVFEPRIKEIAVVLQSYQSNKELIDQKQNELDGLSQKLKRYKNICDLNCPAPLLKMSAREDYYCGSAAEIKNSSTTELTNYVNSTLQPELLNKIENLSKNYEKSIANLEKEIKKVALNDYGHLFVDILRIQDQYIHYYELFNVDIETYEYDLNEKLSFVDRKLAQLRVLLEKYRKYCLQCSSPKVLSWNSIIDVEERSGVVADRKDNLLNIVIDSKIKKINEQSLNDIKNLFSDLDIKIEEIKKRNTNVDNFKPIQDEIEKELQKEIQSFNELNVMVSKENIQNFLSLEDVVSKLDVSIENTLGEVKKLIV